jgi:hypothetical protein
MEAIIGRERVLIYGWLLIVLALFVLIPEASTFLSIEIIFPGRVIYNITAFTLTYPNSHPFRKFVVCFLLSFAPLIVMPTYHTALPDSFPALILLCQYIFIFVVINHLFSLEEIYGDMKNNFFRMIVFQSEAYIKSTCLITSIMFIIGSEQLDYHNFIGANCIGIAILLIAPVIYVLDAFFCEQTPVAQIPTSHVVVFFKCGIFMSSVLAALYVATEHGTPQLEMIFGPSYSVPKLVSNFYFLVWYTIDSLDYGKNFKV